MEYINIVFLQRDIYATSKQLQMDLRIKFRTLNPNNEFLFENLTLNYQRQPLMISCNKPTK